MGEDGTDEGQRRLIRLHENSNFFRNSLRLLGFQVYGHKDSPVIPMMVYTITAMCGISRTLLKHGLAIVVVGYPITPILLTRVRFCISASHTRVQLEAAVRTIAEHGHIFGLRFGTRFLDQERVNALKDNPKTAAQLSDLLFETEAK